MGHIYTDTRPNHPAILADLKMELLEAEQDMQKRWLEYRNTRPNPAALDAYTAATDRCAELKQGIYLYQRGGAA
jgi:hypothetical protein